MKTLLLFLPGLVFGSGTLFAQVEIKGTVYDQSQRFPMAGVSVEAGQFYEGIPAVLSVYSELRNGL